jgi:hypothetical protein
LVKQLYGGNYPSAIRHKSKTLMRPFSGPLRHPDLLDLSISREKLLKVLLIGFKVDVPNKQLAALMPIRHPIKSAPITSRQSQKVKLRENHTLHPTATPSDSAPISSLPMSPSRPAASHSIPPPSAPARTTQTGRSRSVDGYCISDSGSVHPRSHQSRRPIISSTCRGVEKEKEVK